MERVPVPEDLRNLVFDLYEDTCLACHRKVNREMEVGTLPGHVDHVLPVSLGGMTQLDNLQLLCAPCSGKKRFRDTDYRPAWKAGAPPAVKYEEGDKRGLVRKRMGRPPQKNAKTTVVCFRVTPLEKSRLESEFGSVSRGLRVIFDAYRSASRAKEQE